MKHLYIIAIMLLVTACTEEINVKLDSGETRLVVEGSVTSDFKKHVIKLKESSDVFYIKEATGVTNATVTVNDGSNAYAYTELKPGYYESNIAFAGQAGKTYVLSIKQVDIDNNGIDETYVASATMKPPYVIDYINLHFDPNYESKRGDEGEFWLLSLYMQDNVETEDYYGFACLINNVLVSDTITELMVRKDTYFNGAQTKGADVGEFYQLKPDEKLNNLDLVTLETYAISREYYDFVNQLQKSIDSDILFSGSPGNIVSNISNGAVGFFAVYAISRTTITHRME